MPRQHYPGEHKFRVLGYARSEAKKQAEQGAPTRIRVANLRKRHFTERQQKNVAGEEMREQAMQAKQRANTQMRVANLREKRLEQQNQNIVLTELALKRYNVEISNILSLSLTYRLSCLNENYEALKMAQATWPHALSDPKQLYRNFYEIIRRVSHNIVCACCGVIGHSIDEFSRVSANDNSFTPLIVNPEMVPFSFNCGIEAIDQFHIMIDPLAIIDPDTISVCNKCYGSLSSGMLPIEALANFRWIGPVPEELKDLTWVEEELIARSHLIGRVFRLEERTHREPMYSSLKGHIVLVPQNTMRLLDILPISPDSLTDIAHVVWVGKSEPEISKLAPQFTVRKQKVIDALSWLQRNHEDYRNITIDNIELQKWPSVFITEALLNSIARLRSGEAEDALRDGFATEQVDVDEFHGDIPNTSSGIIDINNISRSRHLNTLEELQTLQNRFTINVVPGTKVLEHYADPTYFTSAFPTLFPWGTGKHIDNRRKGSLRLKRWIELLLKNSSRYDPYIFFSCCLVYNI